MNNLGVINRNTIIFNLRIKLFSTIEEWGQCNEGEGEEEDSHSNFSHNNAPDNGATSKVLQNNTISKEITSESSQNNVKSEKHITDLESNIDVLNSEERQRRIRNAIWKRYREDILKLGS